jgi:hypothetical protein
MNKQAGFTHSGIMLLVVVGVAIFGVFTLVQSQAARRNKVHLGTALYSRVLDYTPVESRSSGKTLQRQFTSITSQSDWQKLWTDYHADTDPVPALPDVDFNKEHIIVASRGEQPNGANSVAIRNVILTTETKGSRSRDTVEVSVEERNLPEGCVATQQLQSPYQIIKIPIQQHAKISFKYSTAPIPC